LQLAKINVNKNHIKNLKVYNTPAVFLFKGGSTHFIEYFGNLNSQELLGFL